MNLITNLLLLVERSTCWGEYAAFFFKNKEILVIKLFELAYAK